MGPTLATVTADEPGSQEARGSSSRSAPASAAAISILKQRGLSIRAIARELSRSPSTISRELSRNRTRHDGCYRYELADSYCRTRRTRSRRNTRFADDDWALVEHLVCLDWSPEQVSEWLRLHGLLLISHETVYLRVWADKDAGGELWRHMRQATKRRRKRYGSHESRGRPAGKRHISERPPEVEGRQVPGHWEIDTIMGDSHGTHSAITADNGSEFHGYKQIEEATGVPFYFATPHHSWERGTNENTNGLIRQYLPKRKSMAETSQADLDAIADRLNSRPRKRLGFKTPEECYAQAG